MAQQRVRDLDQAAGAVADQRIGADRAAMVEIDEDFETAADDVVRFSAFDVGDKTDAARVMLVAGIIQAWSSCLSHRQMLFRETDLHKFGAHTGQFRTRY